MRWPAVLIAVSMAFGVPSAGAEGQVDWAQFQGDPAHTGFNPAETVLSPSNVGSLKLKWSFDAGGQVFAAPIISDGRLFVSSGYPKYNLSALDALSGTRLWTYAGGSETATPATDGGPVIVPAVSGVTHGIDPSTGAVLWDSFTGNGISSPVLTSVLGAPVAIVGGSGKVIALDASTGAVLWRAKVTTFREAVESSPAVSDGLVYVAGDKGRVQAIDAETGVKVWAVSTGDRYIAGAPTVDQGRVFISGSDAKLWALDAATGATVWTRTDITTLNAATFATAGGHLYVQLAGGSHARSTDVFLASLDEATGATEWTRAIGSTNTYASFNNSGATVANGVVYTGSPSGKAYAFDQAMGTTLWTFTTGAPIFAPITVVNGMVYVGSNDRRVYVFGL